MSFGGKRAIIREDRILVTSAKLCDIFGISAQTLSNWGRNGCPKGETRGWYDLQNVMDWRGVTGKRLGHGDTSLGGSDGSLMQQKMSVDLQLKEIKADMMKFRHDIDTGKYIEREAVTNELTRLFADVRRVVLALPRRTATMLSGMLDSETVKDIEQDQINSVSRVLDRMSAGDFTDGTKTTQTKRGRGIKRMV